MFDKLNCILVDLLIQFSPYVIWAICFVFLMCNAVSLTFYHTYVSIMPLFTFFMIIRFCRCTNGEQLFNVHPYGGGLYLMQGFIPWFLACRFRFIGLELGLIFLVLLHSFSEHYLLLLANNAFIQKLFLTKAWLK